MADLVINTDSLTFRKLEGVWAERTFAYMVIQAVQDDLLEEECDAEYIFDLMDNVSAAGEDYYYIYRNKDDKAPVGYITIVKDSHEINEIGIGIFSEYRNLGYGTTALIEFCEWWHHSTGETVLKVSIAEDNQPSLYVFSRLGIKELDEPHDCFDEVEEGYRYFIMNIPIEL